MSSEILIVDDNPDIRNILRELISDLGFQTRVAANYQQALSENFTDDSSVLTQTIPIQDAIQSAELACLRCLMLKPERDEAFWTLNTILRGSPDRNDYERAIQYTWSRIFHEQSTQIC